MSTEEPVVEEPVVGDESTAPPQKSNRGLKTAIVVLAALSLGLAILAGSLSASNSERGRVDDVQDAAAAMGSALLTYDYRNLDRTKTVVLRLATGTFRKQYAEAFEGGLDTVLTNTKAVSSVRDVEVFVGEISSNSASAMVVVDTVISGTAGENRRLTSYLQLELVHSGDKWLVDGVTNLNLSLPNTGGASPTTTTTPSVPTTTR